MKIQAPWKDVRSVLIGVTGPDYGEPAAQRLVRLN